MKCKIFLIYTIISLILFNSCQTDDCIPSISLGDTNCELTLDDIIEPLSFTSISVTDSILIRQPSKIIKSDSGFVIFDPTLEFPILAFDKDGKYRSHYGQKGSGPGEYLSVTDIGLSPTGDSIIVCTGSSDIYIYGITGDLLNIRHIDNDIPLSNIVSSQSDIFMTASNISSEYNTFYAFSPNLNLIGEGIPSTGNFTAPFCTPLRTIDNNILYLDWYNNTLYTYDSQNAKIDKFATFEIPENIPSKNIDTAMSFIAHQQEIGFIMDWGILNDRLILQYIIKGKSFLMIYDLKKRTVERNCEYSSIFPKLHTGISGKTMLSAIEYDTYVYFQKQLPTNIALPPFDNDSTNLIIMEWRLKH